MDTTPIYELRERLRAAAIAGTSLLSEDFRLRRACEAFRPLEAASPVFAKLGQMTAQLLSPDGSNLQGVLLETLTLADAVVCTLASVDVKGEITPAKPASQDENTDHIMINAPCSVLKELLDALTTSGSGHYASVCELHEKKPEIFTDYRVKYALVQALGASYSELADKVEEWLIEINDSTMLPLLYRDFDPKGKKEMVRRVRLIGALAGAGANDFYIRMLDEAQKDVRTELLNALRYDPQNVPLLLNLSQTERGKNKDKVFELLAEIQHEDVRAYFQELAQKKPDMVLNYLKNTTVDWSAELVAGICDSFLERLETVDQAPDQELRELYERLRKIVRALYGKGGAHICACYRKLLMKKETVDLLKKAWQKPKNFYGWDVLQYGVLRAGSYWEKVNTKDIETALGKVLHHSLIVNPDPDLQALALELYLNKSSSNPNIKFLPAAATVKFSCDDDCVDWLEEQVMGGAIPEPRYSKECMKALIEAAAYIEWNETEKEYMFFGTYIDVYYPDYKTVQRPIPLRHAKEIMEWVMSHSSKKADEVLAQWVMLNDEEMCQTMGAYFYKKALITGDNHMYLNYMRDCGWNTCKGLGVKILRDKPDITLWELYHWMTSLSEDEEAVMEEVRTVCAMVKSGELKAVNLKIEEFEQRMDSWS